MATKVPKRQRHKKEKITNAEKNNYVLSLSAMMIAFYVDLTFVKAAINRHFLVQLYVDSAVAAIALVVALTQLRYQLNLYHKFHVSKRPLLTTLASFILGLLCVIAMHKSFDISVLFLLAGLFLTKKVAEKEFDQE
jgi:hypothetical protein